MSSTAMKHSTLPKKHEGTTVTRLTGRKKQTAIDAMTATPHAFVCTPARIAKSVSLKMYEPVKPPLAPERQFASPTVLIS